MQPVQVLRLSLVLLLGVWLVPNAIAQRDSSVISKPLPSRFFSPQTIVLARIEIASANIDHIYDAIRVIVPANATTQMQQQMQAANNGSPGPAGATVALSTLRQLADNPGQLAQMRARADNHPLNLVDKASQQLTAAGCDAIYVVLMQGNNGQPEPYFLIPATESGSGDSPPAARRDAFAEAARLIGASVQEDNGWLVASRGKLPPAGDDFGLDAEAFLEALRTNPKHDVMAAIVVPEPMRQAAREEWGKMLKNSPASERHLVPLAENLIQLLDGDWFYVSAHFGDQPALRASAHFASSEKPAALAGTLNNLLRALPDVAPAERSSNREVQRVREQNAAITFDIVGMLQFDSNGPFLVCDLSGDTLAAMLKKSMELRNEPVDNSPNSIDPTGNFGK